MRTSRRGDGVFGNGQRWASLRQEGPDCLISQLTIFHPCVWTFTQPLLNYKHLNISLASDTQIISLILNLFILHTCNKWNSGRNSDSKNASGSVSAVLKSSAHMWVHVFSLFLSQQHASANSRCLWTLQSSCTPVGPRAYQRASWSPIATSWLESQEWPSGYPTCGRIGINTWWSIISIPTTLRYSPQFISLLCNWL